MNEQSSRSHFVFTLRISGVNEVPLFDIMLYFLFFGLLSPDLLLSGL